MKGAPKTLFGNWLDERDLPRLLTALTYINDAHVSAWVGSKGAVTSRDR